MYLEDRADSYAGQCTNVKKYLEDATAGVISTPVVINPENPTAAKEPVLKQFRFQKLCHSICYCGRQGCNRKGWDPADTPVKSIVDVDGDLCVCEMCLAGAVRLRGLSPRELQARGYEHVQGCLVQA